VTWDHVNGTSPADASAEVSPHASASAGVACGESGGRFRGDVRGRARLGSAAENGGWCAPVNFAV
jgi:hypothetical protein